MQHLGHERSHSQGTPTHFRLKLLTESPISSSHNAQTAKRIQPWKTKSNFARTPWTRHRFCRHLLAANAHLHGALVLIHYVELFATVPLSISSIFCNPALRPFLCLRFSILAFNAAVIPVQHIVEEKIALLVQRSALIRSHQTALSILPMLVFWYSCSTVPRRYA